MTDQIPEEEVNKEAKPLADFIEERSRMFESIPLGGKLSVIYTSAFKFSGPRLEILKTEEGNLEMTFERDNKSIKIEKKPNEETSFIGTPIGFQPGDKPMDWLNNCINSIKIGDSSSVPSSEPDILQPAINWVETNKDSRITNIYYYDRSVTGYISKPTNKYLTSI